MNLHEAIESREDSTLCVSLSSNPGTFGTTVHTAGYRALTLDFKYVACYENDIARAMQQVRDHHIRGASISMPFKIDVLKHLDSADDQALRTGAVNTVVNEEGHLRGYNTDVAGFSALAKEADLHQDDLITVIGTGGAARAVLEALRDYSDVVICGRNPVAREELAAQYGREHHGHSCLKWTAGTIVNCTPVGMKDESFPMSLLGLTCVIDVIAKETPLVKQARALGIWTYSGFSMALNGAAEQFRLYTGKPAPLAAMKEAIGG